MYSRSIQQANWLSTSQVHPGTSFHITGGGHWGHCSSQCSTASSTSSPIAKNAAEQPECLTSAGENGFCQPASTCAFLTNEDHESATCSSGQVCCKELLQNDPGIIQQLASAAAEKNEVVIEKPEAVSVEDVENALVGLRFGIIVSTRS